MQSTLGVLQRTRRSSQGFRHKRVSLTFEGLSITDVVETATSLPEMIKMGDIDVVHARVDPLDEGPAVGELLSETGTIVPAKSPQMAKIPKSVDSSKSSKNRASCKRSEAATKNWLLALHRRADQDYPQSSLHAGNKLSEVCDVQASFDDRWRGVSAEAKELELALEEEEEEEDRIFTVQTTHDGYFRGAPFRFRCDNKLQRDQVCAWRSCKCPRISKHDTADKAHLDQWVGSIVQVLFERANEHLTAERYSRWMRVRRMVRQVYLTPQCAWLVAFFICLNFGVSIADSQGMDGSMLEVAACLIVES